MSKNAVVTKKGKNKDQYGRKFGKKHNEAMLEFTKTLWLQDATASLKLLLQVELAQQAFMTFLKSEYGEAQLEFYLEAQKLESMDAATQATNALQTYNMFMQAGGKGIGQQERTSKTQEMWDKVNQGGNSRVVDPNVALQKIRDEAESTLKMLAFDAFPRFVKSNYCKQAMDAMKSQGLGGSQIEGLIQQVDSKSPQDADDWLNSFVATAESFPACIVISDMTIPGAPMVSVNSEFCRTTGYAREEAVGRNCRFLQGPETEPEAIQVIRNTLSKGQDCHVKLTNYRKNGELFQNLLSMRPVFDADNIYRYVIGVQFEIKEDDNLKQRLVQLDKLLRLLPSKLPYRSKASARAKGALAVKTSGEANQMIGQKDQILQQTKLVEMQEQNSNRPKALMSSPMEIPMSQLNLDNTVFAFTKIMWLNTPNEIMQALTLDPLGREVFEKFVGSFAKVYQTQFDFACKFAQIASAQGQEQVKLIRKFHSKRSYNSMFYCTTTEIEYGNLNTLNWGPVFQEMSQRQQVVVGILATDLLPKFMNSKLSFNLVQRVRQKEITGQQSSLRTAAVGSDKTSETFYMDMFHTLSESMSIGMVISDMTIPGIPLLYINEGFRNVTGYGKEKIGTSCRFLQGAETESFLNDEIMAALQQAEPLLVKLHNYKANGQKFQCLFALHPVMGPNNEYKFQIGLQIDFHAHPDITRQLLEMERLIRYLPRSLCGDDSEDLLRLVPSDLLGDTTVFPLVKVDPSEVRAAAPPSAAPAMGGFGGGFGSSGFGMAAPAPVPVAGPPPKGAEIMAQGKEVVTKKGKNKDQYGRSFGKKQKAAMLEFTKTLWLQDTTTSLRNLLQMEQAQQAFMGFLKLEYGEAQLEFYLEAQALETMDPSARGPAAIKAYKLFLQAGGKGIGQQERTASTQKMWDKVNQGSDVNIDPNVAMTKLREEAESTLKMLAFDAFPRFIKSKQCTAVLETLKAQGGGSQIEGMIQQVDSKGPQDADDWLNTFVATAESFPACIVISDMTIPGAPMVSVNSEFCRTTGYAREEAVGRNCRFLQGPETEPEAIQVIRNTLSKGQDCHVKLTNYRKNGELFQNLLSMRPVFDADNIYRYVIGVQFEIKEDDNLKQRLVQLDKLLRLLPSKLPFRSKASARAKGAMAVKISGEANQMVGNKEQILAQAKQQELQEMSQSKDRPKSLVSVSTYDPRTLNYDRTVAAFTKIMWLQDPVAACRSVLIDPLGRDAMQNFAEGSCGLLAQYHLQFFDNATQVRLAQGAQQMKKMRMAHMKKEKNAMFYCATTEIDYGTLNTLNWGPIFENMCKWQEQSTIFLANDTFQRFLEDSSSIDYISKIRQRELAGEQLPIKTAAAGVNQQSESFWLDMFRNVAESVSIGMVISDMTIPGIPLVYINEGFQAVTGYGKEKIGTSCRFLQGAETESFLNDEIMAALQQAESLLVKLHNYKANGQKFQCLFAMHPVFGPQPDNEYKFQIGLQLDFNGADPDLPRKVAEMARVLRLLPQTVGGEKLSSVDGALSELDAYVNQTAGGQQGGIMNGGMMGGMASGMMGAPLGMMGAPQGMMGAPQGMMGAPQGGMMGAPQGMMGAPQGMMGAPQGGMMGAPQGGMMGAPQGGMMGAPQGGMMGAPQGMMGAPQGMMGAPQGGMMSASQGGMMGPPQGGMMGAPQGMMGAPQGGMMPGYSPMPPQGAPPSFASPKTNMMNGGGW